MPIYEYQCGKCGTFEVNQRITESPLRRCPTCKGKVSKLISSTSFQLKGSGWYVTDYASKGGDKKGSTEGAKGEKGEKTDKADSSKAEPAAKPEKESKSSSSSGKTEATAA